MEALFLSALLLSITFCALPGVITAEALRRGVSGGFRPSLMVQLGSMIGDATWAIVALVGLAFLVTNLIARLLLGALGCVFLIYLAWNALRDARVGQMPQTGLSSSRNDFMTGAVVSLGNPWAIAFWLGIGGTAISAMVVDPQSIHYAVFLGGFMLGSLLWCFFFAGLVAYGRKYVNEKLFRAINLVCGVFLGYLGISLLWSTLTSVLF